MCDTLDQYGAVCLVAAIFRFTTEVGSSFTCRVSQMRDWRSYALLPISELANLDSAEVNLACAAGLPNADRLDSSAVLARLDKWANLVRRYTERCLPQFHANPERFDHSEGYFCVLVMVTALQRDLKLVYNPDKVADDASFDANDTFIMGAVLGAGGTCASIPVVIAAVGRRLGYPIKLVAARSGGVGHLFNRWDDPAGERFNIEASGEGLSKLPDDYYRTGEYQVTAEQEEKLCLLRSMTPREELADFLTQRGFRWLELGKLRQAVEAFGFAYGLAPHNRGYHNTLGRTLLAWRTEVEARKPGLFPALYVEQETRRLFPICLAQEIERDILALVATERLLDAPEFERRWWGPLRQGMVPERPIPVAFEARFTATDDCHLEARYAGGIVQALSREVAHV
jgi:hypothetical protein